jgi:O-antigen/teichoic acid export membrane protein
VAVAAMSATEQPFGETSLEPVDVLDSTEAGGRIVRGGAVRFGTYVLMVALSVLSAALLTRHLGVVRFGEYTTVLSLVGVVSAITDAGMSTVGTREFAVRDGAERDALMRDLLGLRMVLTAIGVLLVTAFAVAAGYGTALLVGAVLASLGTIAMVVQHTHTIPLAAALRLGTLSSLDLTRQVLTVAAIVALVAIGAGVLPLLAIALAVNLVLIPPTAALARHEISLRMGLRPRHWLSLLRLTVSFSLATAVGTLYVFTAQILTSLLSSAHQSGLFAASFRIFIVVGAVPGLLVGGALPLLARAARDDRERLAYSLQRIFEVSLIMGVAAALGTLAGAQFMIHVVAGPKYAASAGVLQIQGIALIASFVVAGWSFALLSLKRYRSVLLVNLAAFLVSCSLTVVLAGSNGAKGAAVATLCGESVLAVGSLIALVRGHRELRPKLAILLKVALAAAPAVVLALLSGVPSLVRTLLALGAYGLLIALTRATPREITELIPRRMWNR